MCPICGRHVSVERWRIGPDSGQLWPYGEAGGCRVAGWILRSVVRTLQTAGAGIFQSGQGFESMSQFLLFDVNFLWLMIKLFNCRVLSKSGLLTLTSINRWLANSAWLVFRPSKSSVMIRASPKPITERGQRTTWSPQPWKQLKLKSMLN